MKKISTILVVLSAVALLAFPSAPRAQTITIDSISGTTFCVGDPISVTFTVTGTWGHKNAFTLQLSNDSGTFDNGFQNLGSIIDTITGTFTIVSTAPGNLVSRKFSISDKITTHDSTYDSLYVVTTITKHFTIKDSVYYDTTYSTDSTLRYVNVTDTTYDTIQPTHYRLRVIGGSASGPDAESADNGTDITIVPVVGGPWLSPLFISSDPFAPISIVPPGGVVGKPLTFEINGGTNQDTLSADFGTDASPATAYHVGSFKNTITYSTAGLKIATVHASRATGCPSSGDSAVTFRIYDCTPPVIPHWAIIVDSLSGATNHVFFGVLPTDSRSYWLNPGVHWNPIDLANGGNDTIYEEAGAEFTSYDASGVVVYLKPGAEATVGAESIPGAMPPIVIYSSGASISKDSLPNVMEIQCDSLSFDYSVAPPNSIMHINDNEAVAPTAPVPPIAITPNPTDGLVSLEGIPANANVTALNVLGETVQEMKAPGTPNFTLDLSKLARGTYYIRIASNGSVTTKKIVKE